MSNSNGRVVVNVQGQDVPGQKTGWTSSGLTGDLPVLEVVKLDDGETVQVTKCCGVIPKIKSSEICDYDAFTGVTLFLELECQCGIRHGTARG